jgi:flagellar hook protein FlgE
MQIGLGIKLSSIDVMHTPAPFQRTDNPFDMMIGGDGFFIIEAPGGAQPGQEGYFYTRAGNFKLDDQGYLTTTDGYFVLGYTSETIYEYVQAFEDDGVTPILDEDGNDVWYWQVRLASYDDLGLTPPTGALGTDIYVSTSPQRIQLRAYNPDYDPTVDPFDPTANPEEIVEYNSLEGFTVGKNGEVTVIANNKKMTIAKLSIAMFSNPGGLEKAGNSLYRETSSSGRVEIGEAYLNGAGTVEGGGLEMSNVDLATEFTDMIVTQRGFQASSRIITVSDTMLEELVNLKR